MLYNTKLLGIPAYKFCSTKRTNHNSKLEAKKKHASGEKRGKKHSEKELHSKHII